MSVPSITTLDALKSAFTDRNRGGHEEVIFVNGKPYQGEVEFNSYRGFGWESGRTASIFITPHVDPTSEVILVDLHFMRLRRCVLNTKPEPWEKKQEWEAIDLPEDQKAGT